MPRRHGLKAWLRNRIDQTLDNADAKVDDTTELLAELIHEIIDGIDIELTVNGKPIRYGLRFIPRSEAEAATEAEAGNG